MYTRRSLALAVLASGLLLAQDAPPAVQVTGAVKQPLTLSADDCQNAGASVRTTSNGMETIYQGVWLQVLKRPALERRTSGKALAGYVLAEAQDGYQLYSRLENSTPHSSTTRSCWRTPPMAKPCSARGPLSPGRTGINPDPVGSNADEARSRPVEEVNSS
jgi:hypothetical protein